MSSKKRRPPMNFQLDGDAFKPRTKTQGEFIDAIKNNDITFGVGPAGTGRTYCSAAVAAHMLNSKVVNRIVLVRPAVEAGEKLGHLPGDVMDKIGVFYLPVFESFYKLLGREITTKLIEQDIISIMPLAYIRGITFERSVVILDEAQNTTPMQMKTFLTRIGAHSKMIVNGDPAQSDLPYNQRNGLVDFIERIETIQDREGIATVYFSPDDIVRHKLVQTILSAYENK